MLLFLLFISSSMILSFRYSLFLFLKCLLAELFTLFRLSLFISLRSFNHWNKLVSFDLIIFGIPRWTTSYASSIQFFFVGPCRAYILFNSKDDFHQRGRIGHRSIFAFCAIGLSSCYLRIWRISVEGSSSFWRASIFGSLHIGQCPVYVWAVWSLFYTALGILRWKCPWYSRQALAPDVSYRVSKFFFSYSISWGLM
jgi:hypothetical protein